MVRDYKRKRPRNPDRRMLAAVRLRGQGLSLRQIAERLSCSFSTVRNDLARWEREHGNVVPLCKTDVQNLPRRGEKCTPELHSEPGNVVSLSERKGCTVNPPKWLRTEISDLARGVASGELDRAEVIETLTDHVRTDEDLTDARITEWVTDELERQLARIAKSRRSETERLAGQLDAGWVQPGFEQIYSDYWPRSTYGPETTLKELRTHVDDMLGLSDRHSTKAKEREQRWNELLKAVDGNEDATWHDAERARLGLDGPDAATAGQ